MKLIKFTLLLTLVFFLATFTGCKSKMNEVQPYQLTFITHEFKPLNYSENNTMTGLGPDILKEICRSLNIPFNSTVMPWTEGYAKALTESNTVLYSTVLNAERKDQFKWAGPYASIDWLFYASAQRRFPLSAIPDAKAVPHIGVIKDFAIEQYLVSQGFTNLVYCSNNVEAFTRLLAGEIDLFPSDPITAEAALMSVGRTMYEIAGELTIRTDFVYFAFNKSTPDAIVADFQRVIDALKSNGTLKSLYQRYMKSADAPEVIQVFTEQYPPLTFRNEAGEITGFGTDIVREIMTRNQKFYPIRLSLWSVGYELALNIPNFCLFTMDRTENREDLFHWVGPIGTNTTYFYTLAGSGITITSLDDARGLQKIGTVNSWFSDQYLHDLGFTNLVSDSDPNVMTKKLIDGEIDACVCSCVTFPDILKAMGYQINQVNPAFPLMSSDYYIAFSKTTPDATVTQWQQSFESLKNDGTYASIQKKWFGR